MAEAAWRRALAGLEEPSLVAPTAPREATIPQSMRSSLGEEETARLVAWARERGVTVAGVVQAAWALVLGRLLGRDDVVFGLTVSGRPADLVGVEDMVGLFVNTVPFRARIDAAESLEAFVERLHREQVALLDHQHVRLADVQQWAGHQELFDTGMVFENYPAESQKVEADFDVVRTGGYNGTHYSLNLVAALRGSQLELELSYRADVVDGGRVREVLGWLER
ncbi:condensation domain-containing protein, partial [Streptomyces sedi]|uniref:condensation domain-containing protein n=1 Tax=Streptomyces sedi TaxID=555059 RepID=UPI0031EC5308